MYIFNRIILLFGVQPVGKNVNINKLNEKRLYKLLKNLFNIFCPVCND